VDLSVAQWKRLTGTDGAKIDVNMDAVAFMRPNSGATQIVFADRGGSMLAVLVKELIDEIQRTPTVR
jgi:hypothetical protein